MPSTKKYDDRRNKATPAARSQLKKGGSWEMNRYSHPLRKCAAPDFRKTAPNDPINEASSTSTMLPIGVFNASRLCPAPSRPRRRGKHHRPHFPDWSLQRSPPLPSTVTPETMRTIPASFHGLMPS